MAGGAFSDAEEAGFGAGAIQQVEHWRGDIRVRSVVEAQPDLPQPGTGLRETGQVGSEQAAARPQAECTEQRMVSGGGPEGPRPGSGNGGHSDGRDDVQP